MTLEVLLQMLGVSNIEEAGKVLATFNQFATSIKAATGKVSNEDAQAAVNSAVAVSRAVEALTGKAGGEAVALVTAWKAEAAQTEAARKEVADIKKANAEAEAKGLIDAACSSGQLEPGKRGDFEALNANFGIAALKAALGALPAPSAKTPGGSDPTNAPKQPTQGSPSALTSEEKEAAELLGRTEAEALADKQFWAQNSKGGSLPVRAVRAS
jgi:phage I-like protein